MYLVHSKPVPLHVKPEINKLTPDLGMNKLERCRTWQNSALFYVEPKANTPEIGTACGSPVIKFDSKLPDKVLRVLELERQTGHFIRTVISKDPFHPIGFPPPPFADPPSESAIDEHRFCASREF